MKLHTCIPYEPSGNLGKAYNEQMSIIGPDDWCCFIDHDAMFTTPHWHGQLLDMIARYPKAGLFTAMTNRIGNPLQRRCDPLSADYHNHDIKMHRQVGMQLTRIVSVIDVTDRPELISGVVICTSRKAWEQCKFTDGFLGVDNRYHRAVRDAGYRVYIISGLYVYHWYRETL